MAAQDKRSSHYAKGRTNKPTGLINSRKPNTSRTRQLIQLTNSPTHQLTNSSTYQLKNLKTQKLKFVIFILQNRSNFHPILAKIWGIKWANWHYFRPFMSHTLSIFKHKTCILHHFAFLVWLPTHYFLRPITHFQHLKCHFLTVILPFSALFLMVRRGFFRTIAAYFYAYRQAFSSILPCIQHQNTLRFAPKCAAFCTKTHCVLHQNAPYFAPKRNEFRRKQPEVCCKLRFYAMCIHFVCTYH